MQWRTHIVLFCERCLYWKKKSIACITEKVYLQLRYFTLALIHQWPVNKLTTQMYKNELKLEPLQYIQSHIDGLMHDKNKTAANTHTIVSSLALSYWCFLLNTHWDHSFKNLPLLAHLYEKHMISRTWSYGLCPHHTKQSVLTQIKRSAIPCTNSESNL